MQIAVNNPNRQDYFFVMKNTRKCNKVHKANLQKDYAELLKNFDIDNKNVKCWDN